MKVINYITVFCFLITLGCKDDIEHSENIQYKEDIGPNADKSQDLSGPIAKSSIKSKVIDGIEFNVKAVSAIGYIKRRGEKIAEEDIEDLKKETVFMLEFKNDNEHKNIFDSEKIILDKDKAVQYLMGDVQKDFSVEQEGSVVEINGVSYEGQIGPQNKIRVTFYLKGVDLNKPYNIKYYDRLFGKGLIKFKNTVNEIIS